MFTDTPATPLRVEALLEVVRGLSRLKVETLKALLQPGGLPGNDGESLAGNALHAARELHLVSEDSGFVSVAGDRAPSVREAVLESLDRDVLAHDSVEPFFALFYAFVLGLPSSETAGRSREALVDDFNRVVFGNVPVVNRFNSTKLTGLMRWFGYAGLGWDFKGSFHCCPVPRLIRRLPSMFGKGKRLSGEAFVDAIGQACPELDGGTLFCRANPTWDRAQKQCTLGLAHALVALHEDGRIRLHCALDSRGWSIEKAEPPNDTQTLRSGRIDEVELLEAPAGMAA